MAELDGAGSDLDRWLAPFLEVLGHKRRRTWAPMYLRGLLGPSERKSLQPMAACLGLSGHDQLQHFVASPAWDDAPLWRVLAEQADRLVGGPEAALVIDDTALPKKGTFSAGVARQYCGQLGKRASCQALVSLTLARHEVPVPVGLRLFLPEKWTGDPERCAAAGVPEDEVVPRSKGEIALAELDRVRAAGPRFGLVLADAGYGTSAEFRRGLDERGLTWAVGIPRSQKVYGADVRLVPPGGRRRRPVPDQEPREAEAALAELPWRRVTWRQGTKGPLAARFAATRVRVGDGATWANNRHLPGAEVWLVGEWRAGGERKYYLSSLPPRTPLRALAGAIKARWVCEQAHQQLKQELGLGHFEGRSWTGLHRHALMTCIAFAWLQHLRLTGQRPAGPGGNAAPRSGTATIAEPARGAPCRRRAAVRASRRAGPMPALQVPVPTTSRP
jgi:SRSO17 transposase